MLYEYIIVGAGLAGLAFAYRACKEANLRILILERNSYAGGRIKTFYGDGKESFEEGAGRFNDNHPLLFEMIRELGLSSKIVPIRSDIHFRPSTPHYPSHYIGKSPFSIFRKIIVASQTWKKADLKKRTFLEFVDECTSIQKDEKEFIVDSFGYYAQLFHMNAFNAIKLFDKGMNESLQFYGMQGGLSQIVERLKRRLLKMGVQFQFNVDVKDVKQGENSTYLVEGVEFPVKGKRVEFPFTGKGVVFPFTGKGVVFALPKSSLLQIPFLREKAPLFQSIGTKSLCRIYAKFEGGLAWLPFHEKTTTNSDIRYIIPINEKTGLVMISYSDSIFADKWKRLWDKGGNKTIIRKLKRDIAKIGGKMPTPDFLKVCYWPLGTGFWLKEMDSEKLARKILRPFPRKHIYICGENYSETQGWMEGALETVRDAYPLAMNLK